MAKKEETKKIRISIPVDILKRFNKRVPKHLQNTYISECILMELGNDGTWILEDLKPDKKNKNNT